MGGPNFLPATSKEAIEHAAIVFSIDISAVINPIEECENLITYSRVPRPIAGYHPIDLEFCRRWIFFNSELESPSLRYKFNPELPENYYRQDTLIHLCCLSCLPRMGNLYRRLLDDYSEPNFFHGKAKFAINKITDVSGTYIRSLPYHDCVSFGIRNEQMRILTYSELKELFKINCSFRRMDGKEGEEYSAKQIEKLISLTTQERIDSEPISSYQERRSLGIEISRIKRFISGQTKECKRMLEEIGDEKSVMVTALRSLLTLSLLMRGWDGISPKLPLKEVDSHIDPGQQGAIDIRVSEAIVDFEQKCELLKEPRSLLLLPMMYYVVGTFTFSSDKTCWTIRDRFNRVKSGDLDSGDVTSCIRLSSNWFLFSSCYYLMYLGEETGINIKDIETIG